MRVHMTDAREPPPPVTLKRKEIAMKKLTALLLSALLCLSLLAGCQQGEEEAKNPTCEEVLTAIQEAIGEDNLPMMGEIDDETLSVLYGFEPTELLEDYRGSISQMNVHADEILVMKVKEGSMEDVEAGVAQRQEDLDATWSQYLPEVYEIVQDARVVKNGQYLLFVVSAYADEAVAAFDEMTGA